MRSLFLLITIFTLGTLSAQPQERRKFDPEKFKNEIHKYIADQAQLTTDEQTAFFPLYDEMKEKERALFTSQRKVGKQPQTDADYIEAVKTYDKIDIAVKKLQQTYHLKFLKVLPAKKVFLVIKAEDTFRIHMFKKMDKGSGQQQGRQRQPTFGKPQEPHK